VFIATPQITYNMGYAMGKYDRAGKFGNNNPCNSYSNHTNINLVYVHYQCNLGYHNGFGGISPAPFYHYWYGFATGFSPGTHQDDSCDGPMTKHAETGTPPDRTTGAISK
jgi:hypothetical protein